MTSENEPQRPRIVRDPLKELTLRDIWDACKAACGPDPLMIFDYDPEEKHYVARCYGRDGHRVRRTGQTPHEATKRLWVALTEPDPAEDEATDELLATVKAARQEG